MTPAEIKAAMILKGISQTEIATELGRDRTEVSAVINGRRTTLYIRQAIARAIGKPLLEVFPDEKYREPYGRIVKRAGFKA